MQTREIRLARRPPIDVPRGGGVIDVDFDNVGGREAAPGAFVDTLRGRYLGKVVVAL